jgi:hypothetical protein
VRIAPLDRDVSNGPVRAIEPLVPAASDAKRGLASYPTDWLARSIQFTDSFCDAI